ncbi:MAG: hypothetical protein RL379_26 [Bacillota bacterium]
MKKFIRLLGFALLMVLIAFVGLIAYQENFVLNGVIEYFSAMGISILAPLINFDNFSLPFALTLAGTILYIGFTIFLFVTFLSKVKIIRALMVLLGLVISLGFILLSIHGYYPDATSLTNLGDVSNFVDILLIPIQNPNPGLRAPAFSGLVVMIVIFTVLYVLMSIIDLFRHPFKKQSAQVIPFAKEDTLIAQELSKFVIPSQIRLPQTEVPLPNPMLETNPTNVVQSESILEPTPIVVLPQTPTLPEKEDVIKARATVLQIKERIRSQIRLQLLEAKQVVSKQVGPLTSPTVPQMISPENVTETPSNSTSVVEPKVTEISQAEIQVKVNEAIAAEIAQLEPKTKDQVNTLINEELIKYDSLNREVIESLVSEKIEQIVGTSFEQFKQDMEAMVSKAIQDLQTLQKQDSVPQIPPVIQEMNIEEQVQKVLLQSPLAQKIQSIEQTLQQNQNAQPTEATPQLQVSDIELLIAKQTSPLIPLLEKVNFLQSQFDQMSSSLKNLEGLPYVKQEIYDNQADILKQTQQRLIQLQQDLVASKETLEQFQIETLSKNNMLQEKLSSIETKQIAPIQSVGNVDENQFMMLLKKHQGHTQPETSLNVIQGLIATEVKKQVIQAPTITRDDVKAMIEEAIATLSTSTTGIQSIDENKIANMVQAKLPKTLSELDIQTIVKSSLPNPSSLTEAFVLGLITNEIKKQSIQGPTLTSDDVKRMIEEKISTLPKPTLTPVMDEASITNLVQANLPKALTESDIQTIIQSTIMSQSTQIDTNLASLVATEVNKQLNQDSRLTQDDVKSMIEEAIAKIPTTSVNMPKPSVPQPDQTPRVSASLPLEMIMPVVKKKNARAPENDKRAEQFKSVMTPDLGMTRTGKKKIVRIPFQDRMAIAEPMMLGHYDDLKNYILSYQVKSRISNTGDMFRLHKEEFVKITIAGKSLKLYLALNPEDYKDSPIPVDDASDKKIYQQIPLVFKVKSDLSLKRAKKLVDDLMAKKGLVQKEIPFLPWSKAFIK